MKSNVYTRPGKAIFLFFLVFIFNFKQVSAQQFLTTISGWNAYVHLPDDYFDSTTKKYPLICFLPGIGEIGTDASKLLVYGPSHFIAAGNNMQFMVNGKLEKPIVISIQPVAAWPDPWTLNVKIDSILKRWRCDLTRLNLTALSMGAQDWENYVDGVDPVYTNKIASVVAMSAPAPDNGIGNMKQFALAGGTWWGFEGTADYRLMDHIRDTMNTAVAGSARYTQYVGGHCCWNTWYDPAYNENGESIYTWMLKQVKVAAPNQSPVANAGNDSTTATVVPVINLRGAGNDPDGNPINFVWTKISGPASGTITNTTLAQTTVSGLGLGIYKFELKVTDALGAVGKDTLTLSDGMAPLPLTLVDFSAGVRTSSIVLKWKTTAEINSSHFDIEKSNDGNLYSKIGTVDATGIYDQQTNYQFTDQLPQNGINYYRLKIADRDGSFSYSRIVAVTIKDIKVGSVAINTAVAQHNILQLTISSSKEQTVALAVSDASGRKLHVSNILLQKGMNPVSRMFSMPMGVYYLKVVAKDEIVVTALRAE